MAATTTTTTVVESEVKRKRIFGLCSDTWVLIVAWIQSIWYASKLLALPVWMTGNLASKVDPDNDGAPEVFNHDGLLSMAVGFCGIALFIESLIGLIMGGVLLKAVTKKDSTCCKAWLIYSLAFTISSYIVAALRDMPNISAAVPHLLLITLFYGMSNHFVHQFTLEIEKERADEEINRPFVISKV